MTTTLGAERVELLEDLRRQLASLTDQRARARTERAIRRLEIELAGGRGMAGREATR
jgi:hypothetical protein